MQPIISPAGVWPVMLTPFREDHAIDWRALDALIEWYLEAGVAGLFTVCLSSEMFHLTPAERLKIARQVVARVGGRVPVVASGTFGGEIEAQAASVRRMADTGVSAVVVLTNQLAEANDDDDQWLANADALLQSTTGIPLGLYECPAPYKRLLSPRVISWAAHSGRFVFHKDTSCDLNAIRAKIGAVGGAPFAFYNANTPTLLDSLLAGAHGYCGVGANFYPSLYVWLCHHASQSSRSQHLQRFLSVGDLATRDKYPACAKVYLGMMLELQLTPTCRSCNCTFSGEEISALRGLHGLAQNVAQELGLPNIEHQ